MEILDLKSKMAKGVFWVSLATIGTKVISVGTTMILARLLSPADFGLVAVASIVLTALYLFNDLGLGPAIIHSKANREKVASTAFILMPILGATLTIIAFVTAPITAQLLGNANATNIIRLLSINLLLSSLAVVPSMLLEKDMAYRRKFVPDFFPVIIYTITTIILASIFKLGVYSLVFGQIIQSIFSLILNWAMCRWRPKFGFDKNIARELWRYGKHILGGSTISYLATNIDNIFVSRNSGSTQLGYYTLSYSVANLPATHMADVFSRVLFPSFIRINDDFTKLKSTYIKSIRLVVLLVYPVLAIMAGLNYLLVNALLGDKWMSVAPILAVLTIFTAIRIIAGVTGSLIMAINRPRIIFVTGMISLINQALALYLFVNVLNMGGLGAGVAVSLASIVSWIIIYFSIKKTMCFGLKGTIVSFGKWVLPSLLIFVVGFWLQKMLPITLISLVISVIVLLGIYLISLRLIGELDTAKSAILLLLKGGKDV